MFEGSNIGALTLWVRFALGAENFVFLWVRFALGSLVLGVININSLVCLFLYGESVVA